MKISRKTATRIMSKAIDRQGYSLLGLITSEEQVLFCSDETELSEKMQQFPTAIVFYNQHSDAIKFIESLCFIDGQISIEIFQDIEGVFGLRAYQMNGKMQQPIQLDF
jgi:hypothetical protein